MIEYKIAQGFDHFDLVQSVRNDILNGYMPHGSMVLEEADGVACLRTFYQPMIKTPV